ncbi:MAG: hypothetical protein WCK29_01555 [archaeon]
MYKATKLFLFVMIISFSFSLVSALDSTYSDPSVYGILTNAKVTGTTMNNYTTINNTYISGQNQTPWLSPINASQNYLYNLYNLSIHKTGMLYSNVSANENPYSNSFTLANHPVNPNSVSGADTSTNNFNDDGNGNLGNGGIEQLSGYDNPYHLSYSLSHTSIVPGSITGSTVNYGPGLYDDGSGAIYEYSGGNLIGSIDYATGQVTGYGYNPSYDISYQYNSPFFNNYGTINYATGEVSYDAQVDSISYTYPTSTPINDNTFTVDNDGHLNTTSVYTDGLYYRNGTAWNFGGGSSQTPWTSNINGAGYQLQNVPYYSFNADNSIVMKYDGQYSPRIAFDATFDSDSYGNAMVVDYQEHLGGSYANAGTTISIFQIGRSGSYGWQFIGLSQGYSYTDMGTVFGVSEFSPTPAGGGWMLGSANGGNMLFKSSGGEISFASGSNQLAKLDSSGDFATLGNIEIGTTGSLGSNGIANTVIDGTTGNINTLGTITPVTTSTGSNTGTSACFGASGELCACGSCS